jgi:signal transduction histidine kinase/predicted ATPase
MQSTLINNRYAVVRSLGGGGMGTVCLVEDTLRDNEVLALKRIRADLLNGRSLVQFKNEFAAMAQLRHPNLVEVYDFGTLAEGDDYYFTMEYVPGEDWPTLAAHYREMGSPRSAANRLYEITVQVCRALQYIHSRGFVHYDVKPRNVRITPAGQVKLMDFGLVGRAHGGGVRARGTPEYIAPEVIRGEAVDRRADLYSLGVSLYEIVVGRLPFDLAEDESSSIVLRQHVEVPVEFPPEQIEAIPEALRTLIRTLMAKDPDDRYESANAVIRAINRLTGLNFPIETRETKRGYVQSGAFVGREFEQARIQGLLTRMQQGQGRLMFVTGVAGIGKTRLAHEVRLQAQLQRVLVCEGACFEHARSPYRPWISVFRQLIGYDRQANPELLTRFGPPLTRLMPELRDALSAVEGAVPEEVPAGVAPQPADRRALLSAAVGFMLAHERPLLLVLEDLHYADAETLDLLDALGRRAREEPLLILALYRSDEIDAAHPLLGLLQKAHPVSRREALSTPDVDRVAQPYELLRLDLLSEEAATELVRSMLGVGQETVPDLPPRLTSWLMAETGGNPLFIESLMYNLVEEDLLQHEEGAWHIDMEGVSGTSVSIQAAARRRLEGLDPEILELMRWASVMGRWLDVDVLIEVSGLGEELFFQRIGGALQRHVLAQVERAGEMAYRFSNDQVQAAVYATLSEAERARRHARVAEALRRQYAEAEVAERLAWHFEQAGQFAQAFRYAKEAGDKARQGHANESAVQFYSRALAFAQQAVEAPAPERVYEILAHRAEGYRLLGRPRAQLADLEEMARLADTMEDPGRRITATLRQVEVAVQLGESADALQAAQEALELARQLDERALEADCLDQLGGAHFALGDLENAYICHEGALYICRELEDAEGEAHNLWHLGVIAGQRGQLSKAMTHLQASLGLFRELGDRAGEELALNAVAIFTEDRALQRDYYEQALAIAKSLGDRTRQIRIYNNLGLTYWALGLYGRARELLEPALQIAREMRSRTPLSAILETMGRIYFALGELTQARRLFEEGRALARDTGDRTTESLHNYALGRVWLARGNPQRASELLNIACEMQEEIGLGSYRFTTLAWLGTAFLEMGDWEQADAYTAQSVGMLESVGGEEFPPQEAWWLRYCVLAAAPEGGREAEAWAALRNAYATMMSGIATLSDEGLRRNYLNKVQINHDIITEWTRRRARQLEGQDEVLDEVVADVALERDETAEMTRLKDRLRRVLEVSVRMNETHDPNTLFTFVMDQVIELSGAERGFLVFLDAMGRFDFKVAVGMDIEALERARAQVSYTVLGTVAQSRQPVLLQDALTDERFGAQSSVLELNLRSVLCVPLISGPELVGIIYADNRSVSGRFSQADLDLMMIFANQAATAIENARLYGDLRQANRELEEWAHRLEERVAARTAELREANAALSQRAVQLQTSSQVSQQITSILGLDSLLSEVVELIQAQFGYYFVGVWLFTEEHDAVVLRAGTDRQGHRLHERGFRIPMDAASITASVSRTGQGRVVPHVDEAPDFFYVEDLPDIASEIVLPMRAGDALLGTLNIASDRPDAFTGDDQVVLQGLADQIAIAIRNAELYEAEQSRRHLTELLEQAGRVLTSSLDMREVPSRILALLNPLVPYARGAVFLEQDGVLQSMAQYGFPDDERAARMEVPVREGDVYDQLVHTRRPLILDDISEEPRWQQMAWLPLHRSWLGVPLVAKGRVLGMISLTRREAHAFTPEDARWVQALAAQAGIALENARYHAEIIRFNEDLEQRVQERTEDLNRANQLLSQLDRTKSDFINVAAHELRTPLTVVKGYAQILRPEVLRLAESEKETARLARLLDGIIAGGERLHEIVDSMLDVAKIDSQSLHMVRTDAILTDLIRRVHVGFMSSLEDRDLTLTLAGLEDLPTLQADPDLLYKLFYQLVVNAIKYTPDGGQITIEGRPMILDDGQAGVEVVVSDTGIGIDPEDQDLIFEKFHQLGNLDFHSSGRTKFKGGGPGLGLAIARGIVLAHGGRIWVESEGRDEARCPGSRFYVRLPIGEA